MKTMSWMVMVGLILSGAVSQAQSYSTIYSFTNYEAGAPSAGVVLSGNTFYGVTFYSGATVFQVNTDGTGYAALPYAAETGQSSAGLLLNGNVLYGVGNDFVFKAYTDVTNFARYTTVINNPSQLVLNGPILYGANCNYPGSIYKINADGTGYAVLHSFTNALDGTDPQAGLVVAGNMLYGTTYTGGSSENGTLFEINTNGTGYAVLYDFSNTPDGANPDAGLVVNGSVLYGTTQNGGSAGEGTVFAIGTNGTGYAILKNFTGQPDGANPKAALLGLGNTLYGTTYGGGASNDGTVFQINLDGTGYVVLHNFLGATNDGADPLGNLIMGSGGLYGTTSRGGTFGYNNDGTIYRLTLPPPPLQVATAGGGPVVFWPNDGFSHTLQTTTNLNSGPWTTVSNAASVIGLQITNATGQGGAFYRLQ